ncbi:lipoate--protein ligase family protein [Spirochaeta africana]|uniref:Lipoate-protein ligase A n=1 Tax=Spirochaeta africana (strain ATCC 700263 / DSM 8902 / Z-7692) TaxID=889378 RepID=H9UMS2_SPIAZ|nr:lipoate--protein ligase family protein [Spirochaeta africana]AFG38815.1 lipoate-protein ligase A [Spirochaeta africana DSM 8902]
MNRTYTPSRIWRWIDTGAVPGADAMAIDEALLRSFTAGNQLPLFRLYGWKDPTISIGRFQRWDEDIDLAACRRAGVPLIRRITGGGAIYHDCEVTYSLVCSRYEFGKMTVKESYRRICSFLIAVYRGLGLEADFAVDAAAADPTLGQKTVHCFAGREAYDVLVRQHDGSLQKLGGNAQRRLGDIVFQHGSIPLELRLQQQERLFTAHALPDPQRVTDLAGAVSPVLEAGVGLGRRIQQEFAAALGIEWENQPLTEAETADAAWLAEHKYRQDSWNRDAQDPLRRQ